MKMTKLATLFLTATLSLASGAALAADSGAQTNNGQANAAADAGIGINYQLSVAFVESVYRTYIGARFAFDTIVINDRNHGLSPKRVI